MACLVSIDAESWPIAGTFTIARGSRTHIEVVVVTLQENGFSGQGECVPYARYGETVASVIAQIETIRDRLEKSMDKHQLQSLLPAGAARNAVDCALWQLEAAINGKPLYKFAGLNEIAPRITAYTLSLDTPEKMEMAAKKVSERSLIKVKLGGGQQDEERLAAVRQGAPDADLIIDANEGWKAEDIETNFAACVAANVSLIEQPLPAGEDGLLAQIEHPIPVCADESAHVADDCAQLVDRYDFVNIKLDKTGGLTQALHMVKAAQTSELGIMVGCMLGTSLAMTPALLVAQYAQFTDLDGPLLLAKDRKPVLNYTGSYVSL